MKNHILILFSLILSTLAIANDGAYFASGNQLIPINETDVAITKEILDIVLKDDGFIYVTVDYTFFNPKGKKTILVGFEAPSPNGDVDGAPVDGRHPYISEFSVKMNHVLLPHKVAIVDEETYFKKGKINSKTEAQVMAEDFNQNNPEFYYVYYFNANFKKGVNKIIHTYKFRASDSVMEKYSFDYILTAATRWSNKQIDDFTLNIKMGDNESFDINNTFFSKDDKWKIDNGRSVDTVYKGMPKTRFITFSGGISYSMKNFTPKEELFLSSGRDMVFPVFHYEHQNLPSVIAYNAEESTPTESEGEKSFKILKNLPFAIRGYVFKTKFIQNYYLTQKWYKPNFKYKVDLKGLTPEEKEWLNTVNMKHLQKSTKLNQKTATNNCLTRNDSLLINKFKEDFYQATKYNNKSKLLKFIEFPYKSGSQFLTEEDFLVTGEYKIFSSYFNERNISKDEKGDLEADESFVPKEKSNCYYYEIQRVFPDLEFAVFFRLNKIDNKIKIVGNDLAG